MKGHDDRDANHRHVDAETEPGEEGSLVGAMIAGVRGFVGEEERCEERAGEEEVGLAVGRKPDVYGARFEGVGEPGCWAGVFCHRGLRE